jgi:hypothetical protein
MHWCSLSNEGLHNDSLVSMCPTPSALSSYSHVRAVSPKLLLDKLAPNIMLEIELIRTGCMLVDDLGRVWLATSVCRAKQLLATCCKDVALLLQKLSQPQAFTWLTNAKCGVDFRRHKVWHLTKHLSKRWLPTKQSINAPTSTNAIICASGTYIVHSTTNCPTASWWVVPCWFRNRWRVPTMPVNRLNYMSQHKSILT